MNDPLGLSIGTMNLVAARTGRPPVSRRSTDDGSTHRGEHPVADALDALSRLAGYGAPVSIAVPAHWGPNRLEALRAAVSVKPGLAPEGVPPALIPDSVAAVAALRADPGLPANGVVALCDFGATGANITLVDAAADFAPIGPTVRDRTFSGDGFDEAILNHVLAKAADVADGAEPAGTAAVESLSRVREACRAAKERLSEHTTTTVAVDLPGFGGEVRLTRDELDDVIASPMAGFVSTVIDALARNGVAASGLTAVALVGGGSAIPAVRAGLAERLRAPVITTSQPGFTAAATGARLLAGRQPPDTTAGTALEAPTSMAPSAWATGTAGDDKSSTFRALAWSEDDSAADEPVPYTDEDYTFGSGGEDAYSAGFSTGTSGEFRRPDDTGYTGEPQPLAWYKRPVVLFGLAAALALAAAGGWVYTVTGSKTGPNGSPGRSNDAPAPITVTVTAPDGSISLSTVTPPPPETTTSSADTATSGDDTTTSEADTTTTRSTTRDQTTTRSKAPTTTSAAPPTTTQAPSTTAAPTTHSEPTGGQ